MKNFVAIFIFLVAVNIFVPVFYCNISTGFDISLPKGTPSNDTDQSRQELPAQSSSTVTVMDKAAGKLIEINLTDYLIGAAACEMPAVYESEAIKAQMVAIHSYYLYCSRHPEYLEEGYITVDSSAMTGYADKTALMGFWGMNFYDYYRKFARCAREVENMILEYQGRPALAVYHAVSCGKTQSSRRQWGNRLEYLDTVDSSFDAVSEDYLQIKTFTPSEMYSLLKVNFPTLKIDEEKPEEWFGEIIYADSGYATYVTIGGDMVPGDQFRTALSLPSSCVMVFLEDDEFSVATKGYGHGVGMSQFGANQLSQQGKTFDEILSHYYPGTNLVENDL